MSFGLIEWSVVVDGLMMSEVLTPVERDVGVAIEACCGCTSDQEESCRCNDASSPQLGR